MAASVVCVITDWDSHQLNSYWGDKNSEALLTMLFNSNFLLDDRDMDFYEVAGVILISEITILNIHRGK